MSPSLPRPPLLLHVFSTFATGGPQVRFATIANHFGPRYRHAVIAMDNNHAARERLDPALDITFPDLALPKNDTRGNLPRIRAALRALRPDRLLTYNWGTIEWALANRWPPAGLVPHTHVEDGFGPEERTRQIPRRVWTRRLALAGRTLVVPSLTLETIAKTQWRIPGATITYIPNGIDLTRFPPKPTQQAESPGKPLLIGTVAALRPEKNLARLLRALALVPIQPGQPAPRLLIVGDGPERPALQSLAQELGLQSRIEWAGHLPGPAPLLQKLDLFAMSSDTEQMPISLLEAMAATLPVAATNVGDIAAILPAQQRPYVTPLTDAALAQALTTLLTSPHLRHALAQANRARAETDYPQSRMLNAWATQFDGRP